MVDLSAPPQNLFLYGIPPLIEWDFGEWCEAVNASIIGIVERGSSLTFITDAAAKKENTVFLVNSTVGSWKAKGRISKRASRIQVLGVLTALIKTAIINQSLILNGDDLETIKKHAEAFVISNAVEDRSQPLTEAEWTRIRAYIEPLWKPRDSPTRAPDEKPKRSLPDLP